MASNTNKLLALAIAGGVAAHLTRRAVRRARRFDFQGRTALITGGSRGLGLVLARKLADEGVRIALCARTQEDLDAAEAELRGRGADVLAVRCDVRRQGDVQAMVDRVRQQMGDVDLLFNVAGIIQVGPLDAMTMDDFHNAMDTNCWGSLHAALAVLPAMRRRGWGRIVNVASLGGKRAVPHMLPYSVSKFAQVGLSEGLRAELMQHGVYVTTVCPSLMRTGSPRNAIFKGRNREEHAWFSIGDALPVASMSAEQAADQILRACQEGADEVVLRGWANVGVAVQQMLPGVTRSALAAAARLLPRMGGRGRQAARGYQSQSEWSPSWITRLSDEAAVRNNEMRAHPIEG